MITGMGHTERSFTVIGKNKDAFTVSVKTADRINSTLDSFYEIRNDSSFFVFRLSFHRGDDAARFIENKILFFTRFYIYALARIKYTVIFGIYIHADLRRGTVNGNFTCSNKFFGSSSGTNAARGNKFLYSHKYSVLINKKNTKGSAQSVSPLCS